MKKISQLILVILFISFIIPSLAFASWWNPISWFGNNNQTSIIISSSTLSFSSTTALTTKITASHYWWNPISWFNKSKETKIIKVATTTSDVSKDIIISSTTIRQKDIPVKEKTRQQRTPEIVPQKDVQNVVNPITQDTTPTPTLTCTSWTYSAWSPCASSQQTRTITSSRPTNCTGGNPILNQSCDSTPSCTENNWTSMLTPTVCPSTEQQIKVWTKVGQCQGGVSSPSEETISCDYQTPTCTNFTYSNWSSCSSSGVQSRTTLFTSPSSCVGGNPIINQSCNYIPPCQADIWYCGNWNSCSSYGNQTRNCTKTFDCSTVDTSSPTISQSCTPPTQNPQETPTLNISLGNVTITTTSAHIGWNTNIPTNSKVFLTLDNGSIQVIPSVSGYSTQHFIDVSNLESNTRYSYTIEAINGTQVKKLTNTILTNCAPNWQCTAWNSCMNSQQTRTCSDLNMCGFSTGKPSVTQTCSPLPITTYTVSTQPISLQTVPPGNTVVLGKIEITQEYGSIAQPGIPLRLTVGGNGSINNLSNCQLFNTDIGVSLGRYDYNVVSTSEKNMFSSAVPRGGVISIVCDVAPDTLNGSIFSWGINPDDWSGIATADVGYNLVSNIVTSSGQPVTISIPGTMTISADPSSPSNLSVPGDATGITVGVVKLHAKNESVNLTSLGFKITPGKATNVTKLYIYNNTTLLGIANFNDTTYANNGYPLVAISTLISPFIIPVNTDTQLTIKADIASAMGNSFEVGPFNSQGTGVYTHTTIDTNATGWFNSISINN